jgi:hypothetical protein
MKKLICSTFREGYGIDQIRRTMTAGELINFLAQYDEDTPVYLSFDNGYTYGGITEGRFEGLTMNKIRRKNLQSIIDQLEELKGSLEDLQAEEEEYRDNIPENMQESERYEKADEACGNLSEAVDNLEEVISSIEAAIE